MQECKKVGKAVKKTARVWKFDAFCGRILAEQEFALSKAAAFCTGQTDVTILPGGRAMIEKMADAIGVTPKTLVIGIICFIIAFIIIYIKITIDEKKGVNSQEKADVRKLVDNLVPNGMQYMAAYAHSKEVYGSRTMRREVYHYYVLGFRGDEPDHMWVIPIGVESGKIVYTEAIRVGAENLTHVGGNAYCLLLNFPGKKNLYMITVDSSNTKLGKECQVNIQQPEEARAFQEFAPKFQERVNAALGVDKKGRPLK